MSVKKEIKRLDNLTEIVYKIDHELSRKNLLQILKLKRDKQASQIGKNHDKETKTKKN